MARGVALAAAIAVSLLAVSGAGGAPAQTPKRGGTLVFRVVGPQSGCLNVLLTNCGLGGPDWVEQVLQAPFEVGPDFTFEESLVSRVDYTRRRPFTLTYHIHPAARWSDGVPVTAQDFIFTLRAIRRHGTPELRELHAPVRSARAVDRKTVRVVLRPRFATWRALFGSVLPAHALRGSDLTQVWSDRIDDPRTGRPIGSGPFLVERLERGRQLVLRRNPRYWGPHPAYVERLVIRFAGSATDPTDELRSGELDVAMGRSTSGRPGRSRAAGGALRCARKHHFEQLSVQLGPNAHPALRNKLVRRALAYGIDRPALVRQVLGEIDPSARVHDSAVYVTQSRYYEPNWGAYRYRPAEARRLLTQAGCRRGADGIFSCGGQRLSLRFVTTAGNPVRAAVLTLIQAQLRAAGVEVVPVFAPPGSFFTQILPQGLFDVALFSWIGFPGGSRVRHLRLRRVRRTSPATASGSSPPISTRPKGRSTRVRKPESSTEPTGGLRVTSRRSRSTSFLFTVAYDTSVRNFVFLPWNPFWNAENWWLAE